MPKIDIKSIEVLKEFADGLTAIRLQEDSDVESMRTTVRQEIAAAEQTVEIREEEFRDAASAFADHDEDEPNYLEIEAFERAREKLFRAQCHLSDVQTAANKFLSLLNHSHSNFVGMMENARVFLDERILTAVNYRVTAISPHDRRPAPTAMIAARVATEGSRDTARFSLSTASTEDLPSLPGRLEWVPINDIDTHEIPSDLPFRKASKTDIKLMMQTFEYIVVPALKRDAETSIMKLEADKNEQSESISHDPAFAFECMLGSFGSSDVIALDARMNHGNNKRGISSGRHRLAIAIELGWTHVPARLLE